MGNYTQNLFKNKKKKNHFVGGGSDGKVRISSCALIRGDVMHSGFKSHSEIRRSLGDTDPYNDKNNPENQNDKNGYILSDGRFVNRREASFIGFEAGQCRHEGVELLSSDIHAW